MKHLLPVRSHIKIDQTEEYCIFFDSFLFINGVENLSENHHFIARSNDHLIGWIDDRHFISVVNKNARNNRHQLYIYDICYCSYLLVYIQCFFFCLHSSQKMIFERAKRRSRHGSFIINITLADNPCKYYLCFSR